MSAARLPEWIDLDKEPWHVFMVYGAFTDPATGQNFIVVRRKSGRCPWFPQDCARYPTPGTGVEKRIMGTRARLRLECGRRTINAGR